MEPTTNGAARSGASGIPERRCDIVMKGGVTSGIAYPPAVAVLAKHFRFTNIGGASAGAIAASLTAAAEYRRYTESRKADGGDPLAGFKLLEAIPKQLAQNGALFRLFRPNSKTRSLFDFAMRVIRSRSLGAVLLMTAGRMFRASGRLWAWLCVAAGVAIALVLWFAQPGAVAIAGGACAVSLGAAIGVAIALWRTGVHAQRVFVENGYGLSTGVDDRRPDDGSVLSVWLSERLDEIAGLAPGDHLTFGHLWYGRPPNTGRTAPAGATAPADAAATAGVAVTADPVARPDEPIVNLEMVSTCLSYGRPYTFPTGSRIFWFVPAELRRYVPETVVEFMQCNQRVTKPKTPKTPDPAKPPFRRGDYLPMPEDRDLPVVLVARMSLAFPALLSAVPLGAVDNPPPPATGPNPAPPPRTPEPCWFADGGLSSNFPIHLFDAPLPRWPTFGINLGSFSDDDEAGYIAALKLGKVDESVYVSMPNGNEEALVQAWSRFSDVKSYFGGAMLSAVKDWNDNVQMRVPGFRDRIVTVKLRSCEGGLNLNMGDDLICRLVRRGRAAGELLAARFAAPSTGTLTTEMNWDNHRWIRLRTLLSTAQTYLVGLRRGYDGNQPGDVSYDDMLAISATRYAGPYVWKNKAARSAARRITAAMSRYATRLEKTQIDFVDKAPRPQPDLVKRPRS